MILKVGTFNLNNLFSRYNFAGEIDAIRDNELSIHSEESFVFSTPNQFKVRTFQGRLVKAKDVDDTTLIAQRILAMDLDVLAVQEVEDIGTLRHFNQTQLANLYPYQVLIEGNDPRLIDLGVLSKSPIGGITSWQTAKHQEDTIPVFGRDLLQVDILNSSGKKKLFTLFNNHLKSHFVRFSDDQVAGAKRNNQRRKKQAEVLATIVKKEMRPNSPFIILGDMNDPPTSAALKPFVKDAELSLFNALKNPTESNPSKPERPPSQLPSSSAWTHRFKESGKAATYSLYDQIWLSPSLRPKFKSSHIHRRSQSVQGDGSDHDPAWVVLEF